MTEQLYRYDDIQYAPPLDEFEYPIGEGRLTVRLSRFPILRRTKCGAWITGPMGEDKFVNLERHKKFACETVQSAMDSFLARKQVQRRIHAKAVARAEKAIAYALGGYVE